MSTNRWPSTVETGLYFRGSANKKPTKKETQPILAKSSSPLFAIQPENTIKCTNYEIRSLSYNTRKHMTIGRMSFCAYLSEWKHEKLLSLSLSLSLSLFTQMFDFCFPSLYSNDIWGYINAIILIFARRGVGNLTRMFNRDIHVHVLTCARAHVRTGAQVTSRHQSARRDGRKQKKSKLLCSILKNLKSIGHRD